MTTARELKAKLSLKAGSFNRGMAEAKDVSNSFDEVIVKTTEDVKLFQDIIGNLKIDESMIPGTIEIEAEKNTLIQSIRDVISHIKTNVDLELPFLMDPDVMGTQKMLYDELKKANIKIPFKLDEDVMEKSISRWITRGKTRFFASNAGRLPMKVNEKILQKSIKDAIGRTKFKRELRKMDPTKAPAGSQDDNGKDDNKDVVDAVKNSIKVLEALGAFLKTIADNTKPNPIEEGLKMITDLV
jgi:hypothetical protein